MFDSIHHFITAGYAVPIDFTRQGWRQFSRLNNAIGARYIRAFILKRELAEYITAHEAAGVRLDAEGQELRYDGEVALLLRKVQGAWYITNVIRTEETAAYEPVYFWTRVKRGCNEVLARMLAGWRNLTKALADQAGRKPAERQAGA